VEKIWFQIKGLYSEKDKTLSLFEIRLSLHKRKTLRSKATLSKRRNKSGVLSGENMHIATHDVPLTSKINPQVKTFFFNKKETFEDPGIRKQAQKRAQDR